jgi:hypothetical protein
LTYGDYLVAGIDHRTEAVCFFSGYNLCHRTDYRDVLSAVQHATKAITAEGISNIKFAGYRCVHYCSGCGTNLRKHYGDDGGLLRDDEYVKSMQEQSV